MTVSGAEATRSFAKLGVVVVNFNAGALLTECIGAVLESELGVEVVVSDNGSTDGSLQRLRERHGDDRRLAIVENKRNLGFARGSNVGVGLVGSPYLLFLNPDCIPGENTLMRTVAFMEANATAGMVGCVIRDPGGSEQVASRRVVPDPWIGLARLLNIDRFWPEILPGKRFDLMRDPLPETPVKVEAISGAYMLVRRSALEEVGKLDEGYFLHCEDLDWFVRFREAGWEIYLVPDVDAVHYKGICSVGRPIFVLWHKHLGMARFFRKFQFRRYPLPLSLLVMLGIWLHFCTVAPIAWIRNRVQWLGL